MFKVEKIQYKIKRIKKEINIGFSMILITLLLFSGIIFPNVYLSVEETLSQKLNIPIIASFIVVFSLFIIFNTIFITNKDQLIKEEVQEVEEKQKSE